MMVKVKVRASPYRGAQRGAVGEVVSVKFRNTAHELWKIRFKNGAIWSFYFDELEVLDEKM
jgi:hypothetical protein